DIDEAVQPLMYEALSQNFRGWLSVVAKTKGDPNLWVKPFAQALRGLGLIIIQPVTYERWMDLTLVTQRIAAGCVAVLSRLGLLLAIIGIYGAISYSVRERRKELGLRVALGARPRQLLQMVLARRRSWRVRVWGWECWRESAAQFCCAHNSSELARWSGGY